MSRPVISCVCPTHGRAHVLVEALESFLRQEPCGVETELVILNDCPEQPLSFNHPSVVVVNLSEPLPSICVKFDAVVQLARGDFIAWWEDDDISLPWRLRRSVEQSGLVDNYKQKNAWFFDHELKGVHENLFFGNCFFRKEDYVPGSGGAEGYPDQNAHLRIMESVLKRGGFYKMELADPQDVFFIYRWGGLGLAHDSGFGAGHVDAVARQALFRERTLSHPGFKPGLQYLDPMWRMDYTAAVRAHSGVRS